jgi:predicted ABC-type ATPase
LTADPLINVFRVRSRIESGGHGVPEDKIISRYDRALGLIKHVVAVSDICHIYDNSEDSPVRIYKKRKSENSYNECSDWHKKDIKLLTGVDDLLERNLNEAEVNLPN